MEKEEYKEQKIDGEWLCNRRIRVEHIALSNADGVLYETREQALVNCMDKVNKFYDRIEYWQEVDMSNTAGKVQLMQDCLENGDVLKAGIISDILIDEARKRDKDE